MLKSTDRLDFGKYKNRTLGWLLSYDVKYLRWLVTKNVINVTPFIKSQL